MAAHANAEAVAVLREAESHAARLDAGRHRATLRLLLARSQAQILLGQVPESLDELRTRADLVERVADPSLTAEYHFRLASALGMLGDSPAAIQEAGRALDEAKRAGDLAIEGKAQYILTRESFWSGDLHAGIAHGRQAVALLERAGERWWLAMAHWARALSYTLLGGFDDALDSIARVQTIADRLRDPRLASQAAWTRGWIHAMRGDWATGIEAGRLGLELAPDDMARALAQGFLGSSYVERDDTATALALLEPATEAFRRLRFRQLEGWFTILQAHARVTAGDPGGAAVLPARGEDIVRGVTFAPAVVEARLVEGLIARARGEDGQAEHAFSEALTRSERLGARFFAARMRLALAGLAGARGDHGMKARYLGDDRAEFQALGAPVWAERAAGEASRRVGAAD
jgi:tetratricopeptide (TPR) repeat protein